MESSGREDSRKGVEVYMTEYKIDKNKIYYCGLCAIGNRLPLRIMEDSMAGYCYICGYAEPYVGCLPRDDDGLKNIKLAVDELE